MVTPVPLRLSLLLPLLMLLPLTQAMAGIQHFGARLHEARWEAGGNRLLCTLSHTIPLYGIARFEGRAGGHLAFSLQVKRHPLRSGLAQLASVAPAWMHDVPPVDLGQVELGTSPVPLHLPREQARRLLSELEKGMNPTLSYQDWDDGRDEVRVAIASLNIRAALGDFLQCINGLLPYDFNAVRESQIDFAFGSSAIDMPGRKVLDKVAEYLRLDSSVESVIVEARTDNVGFRRYNERLSRKRAEAVKKYLVANGAPADKFVLRGYGEGRPVATNRSEGGRQENRRAVVLLVK